MWGGRVEGNLAKAFETAFTTAEISLLQDSYHPDDQTSRSAIILFTEGDSLREKTARIKFCGVACSRRSVGGLLLECNC